MNTISQIRSYNYLKKTQAPTPTPTPTILIPEKQVPAFRGVIGQKVVQDIVAKKAVTTAGILAMVGGIIGLSKDKVSDVIEELVSAAKGLMGKNEELEKQNLELKKTLINTKSAKDLWMHQVISHENVITDYANEISQKNRIIAEKDAKIAELQKYEAMAKVKSVDEDLVMPEQIYTLFEEIEANNKIAHESLFNYIMTGKGQEEFLAQMGRNNQLVKAIENGMNKIPEVEEAFNNAQNKGLPVGRPTFITAYNMLEEVLVGTKNGEYIQSTVVEQRVKDNAKALFGLLGRKEEERYPSFSYSAIDEAVADAKKFQQDIQAILNSESYRKQGLEKVSETYDGISPKESYWTFKDKNGNYHDFSLYDVRNGLWGTGRIKNVNGEIIQNNSRWLK